MLYLAIKYMSIAGAHGLQCTDSFVVSTPFCSSPLFLYDPIVNKMSSMGKDPGPGRNEFVIAPGRAFRSRSHG